MFFCYGFLFLQHVLETWTLNKSEIYLKNKIKFKFNFSLVFVYKIELDRFLDRQGVSTALPCIIID